MLVVSFPTTWAGNETSAAWDEATILRMCFFSVTEEPPVLVALLNQPMMLPPTPAVLIAVFSWGEYD